jgi:hypothetical protein
MKPRNSETMAQTPKWDGDALRIGAGRISFPNIFTPKETPRGNRYDLTLLLPPDYNFAFIIEACIKLEELAWGKERKKWPTRARTHEQVVRDCAEKPHLAGYEPGWHFVHVTSSEMPRIVSFDPTVEVTDPKELWAGRWAKVTARPFIYDMKEGVGVSLGLNNIQLLRRDTTFGRSDPSKDFDVEAEEMADSF